jgi:hypothetical protein
MKVADHYAISYTPYYSSLLGPNICVQSQRFMALNSSCMADRYEQPRLTSELHSQSQQKFWNSGNRNVYHVLLRMWIGFSKIRTLHKNLFRMCQVNLNKFSIEFVGIITYTTLNIILSRSLKYYKFIFVLFIQCIVDNHLTTLSPTKCTIFSPHILYYHITLNSTSRKVAGSIPDGVIGSFH